MSNMITKELNSSTADLDLMTYSNTTYDVVALATFWIEGVLTPVVSVCGLSGNLLCILILSRHKSQLDLKNTFTNLLICLAVCDSCFLLFANIVYTSASLLSPLQYLPVLKMIPILVPLIHISLTASVYTTVAVAVERYTTLIDVLRKPTDQCHGWFFVILIFSFSYNIVRFFELDVEEISDTTDGPYAEEMFDNGIAMFTINATWLRRHPTYSVYYVTFGNFLIMSLVPVISLSALNYLIYRGIRKATILHNSISVHHRRDNTMATLLTSIVVVFLCCHSTKLVTNTYEAYQMIYYGELVIWPPWAEVLSRLNHFMLALNASINILIYVAKDFKFRATLSSLFLKKELVTVCAGKDALRKMSRRFSSRSENTVATLKTYVIVGGRELEDLPENEEVNLFDGCSTYQNNTGRLSFTKTTIL